MYHNKVVEASIGRNGIACQYESETRKRTDKVTTSLKSSTVFDTKKLLHELDGARLLHLILGSVMPVLVLLHRRIELIDCSLADLSSTVTASAPPIPNDVTVPTSAPPIPNDVTVTASAAPIPSDNVTNLRGIFDDLSDDVTPSNSDEDDAEPSDSDT